MAISHLPIDTTSTITHSMPFNSFADLPYDIQFQVLKLALPIDPKDYLVSELVTSAASPALCARREGLKHIRCISRIFHDIATPALFASIHLSANAASIKRAQSIAESHLAHHVRELVHHAGTFKQSPRDKNHFLQVLRSHRYRGDYPNNRYSHRSDTALYENYLQAIEDAQAFERWTTEELQVITNCLPNLSTFVLLPRDQDHSGPEVSEYVLRTTGFSYFPAGASTNAEMTLSFWKAFSYFRPKQLNLDLFPRNLDIYTHWVSHEGMKMSEVDHTWFCHFKELESLTINYRQLTGMRPTYDSIFSDRTPLGMITSNIKRLELTGSPLYPDEDDVDPEIGFPKLEKLTFGPDQYTLERMVQITKGVGRTLRHLVFENPKVGASTIEILWQISQSTQLETCLGAETIQDSKSRFNARRKRPPYFLGKEVLLAKSVEALLHKRKWPRWFTAEDDDLVHSEYLASRTKAERWAMLTEQAWAETVDVFEGY